MTYIEREPLLEILQGLYDNHLTMLNYSADLATMDCIEAVIEAPSVDVKSKVAREIFEDTMKALEKGVAEAQKEVNRTTYIRDILNSTGEMYAGYIGKAICEMFTKKYTEEE